MTDPKRVAIYCRVSDPKQEEGASLETQEAACRKYAAERGFEIAALFTEVHTAKQMHERRELGKLRELVQNRRVDVVLAYAIDRLSRNQAHVAILADECERAGVSLEFVTEQFEDSATGKFIRSAKAFAAEVEHEKITERTHRGVIARASAGKLLVSGKPLYGFLYAGTAKERYEIDPVKGPIVQRIFALYGSGLTLGQIADDLAANGVPTATGREFWTRSTIRQLITHPAYKGEAANLRSRQIIGPSGTYVMAPRDLSEQIPLPDGTVPPLVSEEVWQAANNRLAGNRAKASRNNQHPEGLLTARRLRSLRPLRRADVRCRQLQRPRQIPVPGVRVR